MNFTLPEVKKLVEIIKKQLPQEKEEPKASKPPEEKPKKGGLVCEKKGCGRFVSKKVAEYSKKNFGGHIYCFNCQKKH